eukprot:scaffold70157_cov34-Prasinocladus_malaysianus.AAC.1
MRMEQRMEYKDKIGCLVLTMLLARVNSANTMYNVMIWAAKMPWESRIWKESTIKAQHTQEDGRNFVYSLHLSDASWVVEYAYVNNTHSFRGCSRPYKGGNG